MRALIQELHEGGGKKTASKIDRHLLGLRDRWAVIDPAIRVQELAKSGWRTSRPKGKDAKDQSLVEAYVGDNKGRATSTRSNRSHRVYFISLEDRREVRYVLLAKKTGHDGEQSGEIKDAAVIAASYRSSVEGTGSGND